MSDERLTKEELEGMFGPTVPMDAVDLILHSPPAVTMADLRNQLKPMGEMHKRRRAAQDAAISTLEFIRSRSPDLSVRDQAEMVALAAIDAYEAGR